MRTLPQRTVDLGAVESFVVISDVHLVEPGDALTRKFVETLDALPRCDALVLLGDIFDFIYVGRGFFLEYWKEVFDALERVAERGTTVVFVEGNHDFGFEYAFPKALNRAIAVAGDMTVACHHAVLGRIVLRHGDNIVCGDGYLDFRKTIKARWFQTLTCWIPGSIMQFIFSRWAKASRHQDKYRRLDPDFFFRCLDGRQFLPSEASCDLLVLGHVHQNIDTCHRGTRCIAAPSWLQSPNLLLCDPSGTVVREFPTGQTLPLSEGFHST